MFRIPRFILLVLTFVVFLSITSLAVAQDTPAPTPIADVVIMSADSGETINTGLVITNVWAAIGGLLTAFLAGGILATGGMLVLIRRLKSDDVFKTAIENLHSSIPIDLQRRVRIVVETGKELFELADEVTDGKPNSPPADLPASG